MRISLIVPIYNEEAHILSLWEELRDSGVFELIFVDGGSSDKTLDLLERSIESHIDLSPKRSNETRFSLISSPLKGRANQMNYAATKASGDVLFFVHADSHLPKDFSEAIREVLSRAKCGCFKLKFEPTGFLLRICAALSDFRVLSRRIMFGDQGIFIYKTLFDEMGGFHPLPLMEDYEFSIRLKKRGIRPLLAGMKISTSSRRFQRQGIIRTMIQMQVLQYRFRKGHDIEDIARQYRDMR